MIKKIFAYWLLLSGALWITTQFITGINVNSWQTFLFVGAVFLLINTFVKPILKILTLPLNLITLGLFSLILNGAIFWYLGSGIINGFTVSSFYTAFVASIVISVVNWLLRKVIALD